MTANSFFLEQNYTAQCSLYLFNSPPPTRTTLAQEHGFPGYVRVLVSLACQGPSGRNNDCQDK